MGCSLIVNIVMFALTVKEVCALDDKMKDLGMETRDQEMDR